MNLLLTNDDGYESKGLNILAEKLSEKHKVFIVAPSSNRSAVSHCIKMSEPLELVEIRPDVYSCSGFPADCSIVGIRSGLFPKLDAVISGINYGANIGSDIVYSGTCGAARQASMYGIPGIAVSIEHEKGYFAKKDEYNFHPMAQFISENLEKLISWCSTEVPYSFVNVNGLSLESYKGMKLADEISVRDYGDQIRMEKTENGYKSHFIPGRSQTSGGKNSDHVIQQDGYISVSRVLSEPQLAR